MARGAMLLVLGCKRVATRRHSRENVSLQRYDVAFADSMFKPQSRWKKLDSLLASYGAGPSPRTGSTVVVPRMSFWHVRPLAPPNQTAIYQRRAGRS
jgi:hypothetical protein